jgi:hypothetical protein
MGVCNPPGRGQERHGTHEIQEDYTDDTLEAHDRDFTIINKFN